MPVDFLFLSQDDVVEAGGTDMPAVIDVIEGAFRLKAEGQVINPNKVMLTWSDEPGTQELHGRIMAMPAWVGGEWDVAGLKWIPSVPANLGRGLPRANAIVLLSDRETGLPVAVLDGTVISAMRTGAVTGVAIRHLARPDCEHRRPARRRRADPHAADGAGRHPARTRDRARVRPEHRPHRGAAGRARADAAVPGGRAQSEREACEGADIIIPSTLAVTPTIAKEWVPAGGLVVLVSSLDGPEDLHEVTDLLVVDDRDHEGTADTRYLRRLRDAGIPAADDAVDLAEVVSGSHPGRTSADAAHRLLARRPRHGRRRDRRLRAAQRARARPRHVAAAPRASHSGCRVPAMAPAAEHAEVEVSGRTVSISSPDKVFFKERGETKLDHVHYVIAVGEPLLRAIGGRPILMERYPDGASGKSFFQKRVPKSAPDWLQTVTVATVNGTESDALVAVDVAHLVWAVNLGCLGFHAWPTLASDPEHADELRIDLDPGPGVTFEMVRETAVEARTLLAEHGLTGFAKTTGRRGIHIYCRLAPRWDSLRACAPPPSRWPASWSAAGPSCAPWAWWKEERGARVFVDYNQNAPAQDRVRRLGRPRPRRRPGVGAVRVGRARRRSSRTR